MKLKNRILKEMWYWGKLMLFSLIVAFVLKENVVAAGTVPSGSMEETIMTGSRILINRLAYVHDEPERGDIVAFYWPDDPKQVFLKRIMGLPGETIEGINGTVYVDGIPIINDYTSERLNSNFGPFTVPQDCYFMLGDNRNNSWDSRYWVNTYVAKKDILGKVNIVFYPEVKILK